MTKELTLEQATALIKSVTTPLQNDILGELKAFAGVCDKIICYEGDVALPELEVGNDLIIVNGNLDVTGNISDCKGVDSSLLIVLGNVKCKNLLTLSAMHITGDLHVEHTLLGDSLNDYACNIGGNLQARTIIENGHWIRIRGEATYQYLFDSHCKVEDRNGRLKPNLANEDLMDDFVQNPKHYAGYSYVPMIEEVQEDYQFNLPKAFKFIKDGGELFCKQEQ
jgi:hypothetical protein